jgi:hypothetical protein
MDRGRNDVHGRVRATEEKDVGGGQRLRIYEPGKCHSITFLWVRTRHDGEDVYELTVSRSSRYRHSLSFEKKLTLQSIPCTLPFLHPKPPPPPRSRTVPIADPKSRALVSPSLDPPHQAHMRPITNR